MPASAFPRIHISCPCVENREQAQSTKQPHRHRHSQSQNAPEDDRPARPAHNRSQSIVSEYEDEGQMFDPWNPRSTYSLFPLDHLLYCEDCGQVRCPRCVIEEIVCYFCPNCLFEVPSATVKAEGNRCNRNCFSCPLCFASLSVVASDPFPPTDSTTGLPQGPFLLLCNFCHWSSSKVGIEFQKPTSITTQLSKMQTSAAASLEDFDRMKLHYTQKGKAAQEEYAGTGALNRLIGMYSGIGGKRALGLLGKGKKVEVGEAPEVREIENEDHIIEAMRRSEFGDSSSLEQRYEQAHEPRFNRDILPLAALLRTKRSKRCRACRHILVKPEAKVQSIRFRIKLVAMNYIPTLSLSRLESTAINYNALRPLTTHKYLLTVTNPLFDPISITLATPSKTPGKYQSSVTILCPQFEVGANTDVWEEALQDATSSPGKGESISNAAAKNKGVRGAAGNIFDCGRNWTAVVLEVVPPVLDQEYWDKHKAMGYEEGEEESGVDEAVIQIPVFVRVVYEVVKEDDVDGGEKKEKREHAYWYVLSVGRIGYIPSSLDVKPKE